MQTAGFFTSWLKDLAAEQEANGMVANIVPSSERGLPRAENPITRLNGAAGWGDAAVIVPWTLYQCFGDQRILEEQYASMKARVEYERQQAQNKYAPDRYTAPRYLEREPLAHERYLWDTNFHWGEWLEPNDPLPGMINTEWTSRTRQLLSAPHIATAFFARSTHLLAEAARVLGKEDDVREYSALHQQIKEAYIAEFVEDDGRLWPDRQASYVRALAFDLLPEHLRASAIQRLVELVQSADIHLGTGFLSTPYLCPVLGDNGHLDLAYALLMQDTPPSWLYAVKKGATTIWESWDGIDEEGNPHHSLNHYSYGAIGNWLYQVVAGIAPGVPGYRHTMFQPQPGGGLTFASATYQSLYGEIATSWQIDGERFQLSVTVPTNTTATVIIPARLGRRITEGGVALESAVGIRRVRREQKATSIEIGSGMYTFTTIHNS
jgi:alpha-L-rhamnosidase